MVGGCSSAGRAPALQAGGQRFDPVQLHQLSRSESAVNLETCSNISIRVAQQTARILMLEHELERAPGARSDNSSDGDKYRGRFLTTE